MTGLNAHLFPWTVWTLASPAVVSGPRQLTIHISFVSERTFKAVPVERHLLGSLALRVKHFVTLVDRDVMDFQGTAILTG